MRFYLNALIFEQHCISKKEILEGNSFSLKNNFKTSWNCIVYQQHIKINSNKELKKSPKQLKAKKCYSVQYVLGRGMSAINKKQIFKSTACLTKQKLCWQKMVAKNGKNIYCGYIVCIVVIQFSFFWCIIVSSFSSGQFFFDQIQYFLIN